VELLDIILRVSQAGSPFLLALAVVALIKGWVVTRRELDREREISDEYRRLAYRGTETTNEAIKLADPSQRERDYEVQLERGRSRERER
jgi:hypothetical protein